MGITDPSILLTIFRFGHFFNQTKVMRLLISVDVAGESMDQYQMKCVINITEDVQLRLRGVTNLFQYKVGGSVFGSHD